MDNSQKISFQRFPDPPLELKEMACEKCQYIMLTSFFKCSNCLINICSDCCKISHDKSYYCPNCGEEKGLLNKKKSTLNTELINVFCENFNIGCTKPISFKDLFFHQTCQCDFRKFTCQHCQRKDLLMKIFEKHDSECEFRKVPCPECKQIIIFKDMIEHKSNECLNIKASCRFCEKHIKVSEINLHLQFCQFIYSKNKVTKQNMGGNIGMIKQLLKKILYMLNNNIIGLRGQKDDHKLILNYFDKATSNLNPISSNSNLLSQEIEIILLKGLTDFFSTIIEGSEVKIDKINNNIEKFFQFYEKNILFNPKYKKDQDLPNQLKFFFMLIPDLLLKSKLETNEIINKFYNLFSSWKNDYEIKSLNIQNEILEGQNSLRLSFSHEINELKKIIHYKSDSNYNFNFNKEKQLIQVNEINEIYKKNEINEINNNLEELNEKIIISQASKLNVLKTELDKNFGLLQKDLTNFNFDLNINNRNALDLIIEELNRIDKNLKISRDEIEGFKINLITLHSNLEKITNKRSANRGKDLKADSDKPYKINSYPNYDIKLCTNVLKGINMENIEISKEKYEEFNQKEQKFSNAKFNLNLNEFAKESKKLCPESNAPLTNKVSEQKMFSNLKIGPTSQENEININCKIPLLGSLEESNLINSELITIKKPTILVLGKHFLDQNLYSTKLELIKNKFLYYLDINFDRPLMMILHIKNLITSKGYCFNLYKNLLGINITFHNNLIICGGGKDSSGYLNTCAVFNLMNMTVDFSPKLNEKKSRVAFQSTSSNILYCLGGEYNMNALKSCEFLDYPNYSWQFTHSLNSPNMRITSIFLPSNFIFSLSGSESNIIERLNISSVTENKWELIKTIPSSSRAYGCTFLLNKEKVLIFGGVTKDDNYFNIFNSNSMKMIPLSKKFTNEFNFNFAKLSFYNESLLIVSIDPRRVLFTINLTDLEYKESPIDF